MRMKIIINCRRTDDDDSDSSTEGDVSGDWGGSSQDQGDYESTTDDD